MKENLVDREHSLEEIESKYANVSSGYETLKKNHEGVVQDKN